MKFEDWLKNRDEKHYQEFDISLKKTMQGLGVAGVLATGAALAPYWAGSGDNPKGMGLPSDVVIKNAFNMTDEDIKKMRKNGTYDIFLRRAEHQQKEH